MSYFKAIHVDMGWGRQGMAVATGSGEWIIVTNHPDLTLAGELWEQLPPVGSGEKTVFHTFVREQGGSRRKIQNHETVIEAVTSILSGPSWWTDEEAVARAEDAVRARGVAGR